MFEVSKAEKDIGLKSEGLGSSTDLTFVAYRDWAELDGVC